MISHSNRSNSPRPEAPAQYLRGYAAGGLLPVLQLGLAAHKGESRNSFRLDIGSVNPSHRGLITARILVPCAMTVATASTFGHLHCWSFITCVPFWAGSGSYQFSLRLPSFLSGSNGECRCAGQRTGGILVQRSDNSAGWGGSMVQRRLRCFQFGSRDGSMLAIPRTLTKPGTSQPTCLASEGRRSWRRGWEDFCELQGLPRTFTLPGWTQSARYRAVGNGVPIPLGRAIAAAVSHRHVTKAMRLCACHCGRAVTGGASTATAACRKRMERLRKRDAATVTGPAVVTPAVSQIALDLPGGGVV